MINEFGIEWVVFLDDGGWVMIMVVGCGVIVGSDGLWVCERVNNKKL